MRAKDMISCELKGCTSTVRYVRMHETEREGAVERPRMTGGILLLDACRVSSMTVTYPGMI